MLEPATDSLQSQQKAPLKRQIARFVTSSAKGSSASSRAEGIPRPAQARSTTTRERVTMRPAAACDWCPRQRRLIWVGAAYRLATAAPLPPLTYVASSLGYELDCLVQELDNQGYQSQESVQPVHRQITSLHRRRRCRLAGLTPLTYLNYSRSDGISQTYVRFSNNCHPSRKAA